MKREGKQAPRERTAMYVENRLSSGENLERKMKSMKKSKDHVKLNEKEKKTCIYKELIGRNTAKEGNEEHTKS